jgi:hypothetical protein
MPQSNFQAYPYSVDELKNILANSSKASLHAIEQKSHISYLDQYLLAIGVKTILVEYEYIDRDFLEDFAGYYVRCFPDYERKCARLHFFSSSFDRSDFEDLLANQTEIKLSQTLLQETYLGFIVIKPLPLTIIGRTCIKTYPNNDRRCFPIVRSYKSNLFGIELGVETLAFQEQDQVAAACATSALWTVFQGTGVQFQHSILSPVEITKKAFSNFPLAQRVIPSANRALPNIDGLTAEMMAQAIRDIGLEPYCVSRVELSNKYYLQAIVNAYLKFGIPLLLGFDIIESDTSSQCTSVGKHAVAITGYSFGQSVQPLTIGESGFLLKASSIDKIYVHDDQVGPFARMEFCSISCVNSTTDHSQNIDVMSTSWGSPALYSALPDILLIPLYHKIRIPFILIQESVIHFDRFLEDLRDQEFLPSISQRFEWDIYLTRVNDFKKDLFSDSMLEDQVRKEVLLESMPRFLWRATAFYRSQKKLDLIFDATDINQGQFFIMSIKYDDEIFEVLKAVSKISELENTFQISPAGKILEWFSKQ